MPTFDFECEDCKKHYEGFTKFDSTGQYPTVKCPECSSIKKKKLVSNFSFSFGDPVGTDKWNGSHDYRFNHKLPIAHSERENAMKKSHVGEKPYSDIDDISPGKHFGEVK